MNYALLEAAAGPSMWSSLLMMAIIILVFWFFIIRPQRKRDKETAKMRSELQIGDEIVTIGGIIGIIVSIKEETLVIETGSDRSKVRLARWAIQSINKTSPVPSPAPAPAPAEEKPEKSKKAEKKAEKEAKNDDKKEDKK